MSDNTKQPYVYYKFLGVSSFIKKLEQKKLDYHLFKEDDYSSLFETKHEILKEGDTVYTGFITKDGQKAFFTEFGLRITRNFHSYIVFIFDHHPETSQLLSIVEDMESIVMSNLDNVDISQVTSSTK